MKDQTHFIILHMICNRLCVMIILILVQDSKRCDPLVMVIIISHFNGKFESLVIVLILLQRKLILSWGRGQKQNVSGLQLSLIFLDHEFNELKLIWN